MLRLSYPLSRDSRLSGMTRGLAPLFVMLASLLAFCASAQQKNITGQARVVDGDTLAFMTYRVRLYGVDAPETAQYCLDALNVSYACGNVSKQALANKIGNSTLTCIVKDIDIYGRSVSICGLTNATGAFEDVNAWLVSQGYAVAYRQFSKMYVPQEDQARAARLGVWQGQFQMPWDWRNSDSPSPPPPLKTSPPLSQPPPLSKVPPPQNTKPPQAVTPSPPVAKSPPPSLLPPPSLKSPPQVIKSPPPLRLPPLSPPPFLVKFPPPFQPPSPVAKPPPSPSPSPPPSPRPPPPPSPNPSPTPPSPPSPNPVRQPPLPSLPTTCGDPVPMCPTGPAIKGNIASSGEKIYHVPGGKYYDSVCISLKNGERFFCTEAEAQAAGWRPAFQR
ncbi:hypothetical protein Vretifemale_13809 [Volvox reticuliferus]|uniref:TNase-like domain-containing protein n=1 Tax=Volvox reticuliferus TaxID=1737510 RepID=A0A8J4CRP2_9CHLO|nr:hypothetical protein Vretifemale_13809 [Volvox reticuliferus]